MGFIYKITNDINDKVYVGKTLHSSIEERWQEHINDSKKEHLEKRPLYNAINKYGINHFTISLIGEYPDEELNDMEIYWIGYYNGYNEGYNATKGGDGKQLYDHKKIIQRFQEYPYPLQVANEFNCSSDLVRELAVKNNIQIRNFNTDQKKKAIKRLDKEGNLLEIYDCVLDAGKWCLDNKLSKNNSLCGLTIHITDVANGTRKSAYGYKWEYLN